MNSTECFTQNLFEENFKGEKNIFSYFISKKKEYNLF